MIPGFKSALRQEMTGHPDGALSMASWYVLVRCMGAEKLEKSLSWRCSDVAFCHASTRREHV